MPEADQNTVAWNGVHGKRVQKITSKIEGLESITTIKGRRDWVCIAWKEQGRDT